jgi:O-antigen/teichoic acid export membrane protein
MGSSAEVTAIQPDSDAAKFIHGLGWVKKGSWAIADQGLFAGSNFIATLLLARLLSPANFGMYALLYSAVLFVTSVHNPLIMEPMLLFGATRYEGRFRSYFQLLLSIHWLFTFSVCLLALVTAGCLGYISSRELSAVFAAFLAAPCILFCWMGRRSCYVRSVPNIASFGGLVYLLFFVLGTLGLSRLGYLSAATVFGLMAIASVAAGLVTLPNADDTVAMPVRWRPVVIEHWIYGRWALGGGAMYWVPASWYYFVLASAAGLSAVGHLRALTLLIAPVAQVTSATGLLILPRLARERSDIGRFRRTIALSVLVLMVATLTYWFVVGAFGAWAGNLLLSAKWHFQTHDLIPLGAIPFLAAIGSVFCQALRARGETKSVCMAYAAAAFVTVTMGTFLVKRFGIEGAVYGMVLSELATTIMLAAMLTYQINRLSFAAQLIPTVE